MATSPRANENNVHAQAIPQGDRLLHIGPHKTGSSAIQNAMHLARDTLATHGVHYAGRNVRPRKAVWSLGVRGRPAGSEQPPIKHWKYLLRDIGSTDAARVCLSNEDFGRATPDQIERVVTDLGGPGRIQVVAVARRLDRYLPSQWQERVKAGERAGFDEWLRFVLDGLGEPVEWGTASWEKANVQYAHDPFALAGRWADVVGPERFTLVVSDETDREFLFRVFEEMLGLPERLLEPPPRGTNTSLPWAEVDALAAINAALADRGLSRATAKPLIGRGLAKALKSQRTNPGKRPTSPPVPRWALDRVRGFMENRIDAVRELGVNVVGDLESLRVPEQAAEQDVEAPRLSADEVAFMLVNLLEASGYFESDDLSR